MTGIHYSPQNINRSPRNQTHFHIFGSETVVRSFSERNIHGLEKDQVGPLIVLDERKGPQVNA